MTWDRSSGQFEAKDNPYVIIVRAPEEEWWEFDEHDWVRSPLRYGDLGKLTIPAAVTNMRSLLQEEKDPTFFSTDFVFEGGRRLHWVTEICNLLDPASLGLES